MLIVLDANIVIAALMGSRGKIVILTSRNHSFYAPKKIVDETRKHKGEICEKTSQTSEEFEINYEALLAFIDVLDLVEYEIFMEKAKNVIGKRDIKDADYIACALAFKADFIWSDDRDFEVQDIVPVKTTDQFIEEGKI